MASIRSYNQTIDGYQWTPASGVQRGLESIGAIRPTSNLGDKQTTSFDVVVIGAGYAGLIAARDLINYGFTVLLLEGRDRIGGRTWSARIDDNFFDLGGSWISPDQCHVWSEITRYKMLDKITFAPCAKMNPGFTLKTDVSTRNLGHEEEGHLLDSALQKFADVDGADGRTVFPLPFHESLNAEYDAYSQLSLQTRLEQIKHRLSPDEVCLLSGTLTMVCGCPLDHGSFSEFLHWWALCGYSYSGLVKNLRTFRLKEGQSTLAIEIFGETLQSKNFSYALGTKVECVSEQLGRISVTTQTGKSFEATRAVVAIPQNALESVSFEPRLSWEQRHTNPRKHVNRGVKVHFECQTPSTLSWGGIDYPGTYLNYFASLGEAASGSTIIEAFGHAASDSADEINPQMYREVLGGLVTTDVRRIVSHDWADDQYSQGAWFYPGLGMNSRDQRPRNSPDRGVHFASSDWASGWRCFIDGAIEQGRMAALEVRAAARNDI